MRIDCSILINQSIKKKKKKGGGKEKKKKEKKKENEANIIDELYFFETVSQFSNKEII